MHEPHAYAFDRALRYDELVTWLQGIAAEHPALLALETYGASHEGRDLWLVTITDATTGAHDTKPAHWVDASIHAVELTATIAACHLIHSLVTRHARGDETVVRALRTRTFYVVPRVNPDGAEWVLADRPRWRRSSTRPWPWRDAHRWPGLHVEDIDGDGRVLSMRVADPNGGWIPHPDDARLMIPAPATGAPAGTPTYRLLSEGVVADFDGFTIPTPRSVEGLDLNRNFPADWATNVTGSGDHPLSEPEVDSLVRAIASRPNICGYNAFHTHGGVLLRPSSTRPDAKLDPFDVWVWKQLGAVCTELTSFPVHSVREDFTWDPDDTMSGAADDWAYDHLGVFGWTTEFWDVVAAATDHRSSTHSWYTGPTDDESLAVLRWCDQNHPSGYVDWYPFDHPQLGPLELGGWDALTTWINPPPSRLRAEIEAHADFAIHQALCSPRLEIVRLEATRLDGDTYRVAAGVANTGWLATDVSSRARRHQLVKTPYAELSGGVIIDGAARRQFGHLEGRATLRFRHGHDGTADRTLVTWIVRAPSGTLLTVTATGDRAGTVSRDLRLD